MPANSTTPLVEPRIRNHHIIRTMPRISKGAEACPDWNAQLTGKSQRWQRCVTQDFYLGVLVADLLAARNASTLPLSTNDEPVSTKAGMGAKLSFDQSTSRVFSLW